ncbi:hypothetical protein GOFOIKOB_6385 [Methylobacterium tardum]|nr:hypothetical protein GOFOIKOB_6385 [Methylobacterium tardum]
MRRCARCLEMAQSRYPARDWRQVTATRRVPCGSELLWRQALSECVRAGLPRTRQPPDVYDLTEASSCKAKSIALTSRSAVSAMVGSCDIAPAACCSVRNSRRRVAGSTPRAMADCTRPWTSSCTKRSSRLGAVQPDDGGEVVFVHMSAVERFGRRHLGWRRPPTRSIRPSSSKTSHASLTTSPRRRAVMPARSAICWALIGSSVRAVRMRARIGGRRLMVRRTQ